MYVVVVGSRGWQGQAAEQQVNAVLDSLRAKYSGMIVVSSSTDKGVGAIVKERCMNDKGLFQLVDLNVRIFGSLSHSKLVQIFDARNAALAALGEEFHVFVESNRRGAFEDLIEKLEGMEGADKKSPLYKYVLEGGG